MTGPAFNYQLPRELIAKSPASPRDSSRLMVINRRDGSVTHRIFRDLPRLLNSGDVLVFNNTRVFPARLHGRKNTGGIVEILLLKNREKGLWEVISHPGIKPGQTLLFPHRIQGLVKDPHLIEFSHLPVAALFEIGVTPLPPYIKSLAPEKILRRQYQTVYAQKTGSAAAPTAGLHFTRRLLSRLKKQHIQLEYVTLHIGLGTFQSPTANQIRSGKLHTEFYSLDPDTARRLNSAKAAGRRIIAVGTTATRVLETLSDPTGCLSPGSGETDIFIKSPYHFKFISGLITNFHLPGSSLLMLVSALAGPQLIESAYKQAVTRGYRFFSFGDACLII